MLADQRRFWDENGFLLLPRFFDAVHLERIERSVEEAWRRRPRSVVVDDLVTSRRRRISEVSEEDRTHRFKLNDLYLEFQPLREVSLDGRLVALVESLLGDAPVLCNTLNLRESSEQDYHSDSIYMTPLTPGALVAAWIALEPVRPDAGPLVYYPGSHKIPPFPFSGGLHAVDAEMPRWATYIQSEIERRGLVSEVLRAEAGDVFLWHGNLLHGARKIENPSSTRKSLVCHYLTLSDCRQRGYRLKRFAGSFWIKRRPQPVTLMDRLAAALERRVFDRLRASFYRL
jgi:phytanoyl-CoA hydroxylase